jgi:succinyl-diaminopimelate desuccinylase
VRFYHEKGMDAVIFGIGGDGLHGADEYADTTTIAPYYHALRQFVRNPWGHARSD